jgi:hypothetical protein
MDFQIPLMIIDRRGVSIMSTLFTNHRVTHLKFAVVFEWIRYSDRVGSLKLGIKHRKVWEYSEHFLKLKPRCMTTKEAGKVGSGIHDASL